MENTGKPDSFALFLTRNKIKVQKSQPKTDKDGNIKPTYSAFTAIQKDKEKITKKPMLNMLEIIKLREKEKGKAQELLTQIKSSISTTNPLTMSPLTNPPKNESISNPQKEEKPQVNYPISAIGLIKSDFGDGLVIYGTGTLIAPKIVLTCAHLLYNPILKKKIRTATFYMNIHRGVSLKECQIDKYVYPAEFEQDDKTEEDYAICVLANDIGAIGGYLGLCPFNKEINTNAYVYGYANSFRDKDLTMFNSNTKTEDYLIMGCEFEIRLDSKEQFLIYIGQNTYNGQDGSPLFRIKQNDISTNIDDAPYYDIQIIGVDCSSNTMFVQKSSIQQARNSGNVSNEMLYYRLNKAVPLTEYRYNQIFRWMNFYLTLEPNINKAHSTSTNKLSVKSSSLVGNDMNMLFSTCNLKQFVDLDLSYNLINKQGIRQLIINEESCLNLISLNLMENLIDAPAAAYLAKGNFPVLKILNISFNQLGAEGARELTKGSDFSSVETLDISNNGLTNKGVYYIVNSTFYNVKEFTLNSNQIDNEGAYNIGKGNMKALTHLTVKSNKIGNEGVLFLSKTILKQLTHLDLEWNALTHMGMHYLSGETFSNISSFNISNNNQIGIQGVVVLATQSIANLTNLYIASNMICTKGAEMIGMLNLCYLEILDISDNNICDLGLYYLSTGVLTQLRELNVSLNQITEEGVGYLAQAVFSNTLEWLNIEGNKIKDKGIEHLAYGKFRNISYFKTGENQLTSKSAYDIYKGNFQNLTNLYVENNDLLDEGVNYLMKAQFVPYLKEINLSYNQIGNQGCELLAKAGLTSLELLNIKMNYIDDQGVVEISKGTFPVLKFLNLEDNEIGSVGAKALASGHLINLIELKLKGNKLKVNDMKMIKEGNMKKLTATPNGLSFYNFSKISASVLTSKYNKDNNEEDENSKSNTFAVK